MVCISGNASRSPVESGADQEDLSPPGMGELLYLLVLPIGIIGAAAGLVILLASAAGMLAYYWGVQIALAGAVAGIGALLGSLAVVLTWRLWPEFLPQGLLAAVGVRLIVTLSMVLVVALTLSYVGKIFFLGTAGFYIIGLISETILAIKVIRKGYIDQSRRE